MYINTKTKQYPLSELDIRRLHPNTLFTSPFSPPPAYALVEPTPMPNFDPFLQITQEGEPVEVNGKWIRTWSVIDLSPEKRKEITEERNREMSSLYLSELESFFDKKAREKRYDNRISCAIRSGYLGPYQDEGIAFAKWMDSCNELAYKTIESIESGEMEQIPVDEFIETMPTLKWPN